MQFVQSQNYIGTKRFRFWGLGPRDLKGECTNCGTLQPLSKQLKTKASGMKYKEKSERNKTDRTLSKERSKYYFVLKPERRRKIQADNRKQGVLSMIIGVVIGVGIAVIPTNATIIIGTIIMGYSIIGGLYGIYEDPERKHRSWIDHGVKKK